MKLHELGNDAGQQEQVNVAWEEAQGGSRRKIKEMRTKTARAKAKRH